MGLRDIPIKNEYRSLIDDVVKDFYVPLLGNAVLYQRAVGFFSSSALTMIAKGIDGLVQNEGKIQIIASPRLSTSDIEEIRKGYEVRKIIEKSLIREISDIEDQEDIEKLSYIARLVADGILDVKIAFLTTKNEIAMYHEKMGLITDSDGNTVAFSGSMNESENAFKDNYESFDAFCSWTNDSERVFQKQMAFKAIWEDYEPGVETIDFPEAVKNRLYEYNPDLSSKNNKSNEQKCNELDLREKKAIFLPDDFKIREYQNSAIHIWEEKGFRGIYDMATGTGKTLTALASIEYLYRKNRERLAIIIVCPYQHLVEQWVEDIVRFGIQPIIGYSASSQKNWKKNLEQAVRSFNLKVTDMFCFVTTNASFVTKKVQEQILLLGKDSLFVVDEAHNMGAANYRRYLPTAFEYRLALSATIDRHNDETGTTALTDYFGEKCIEYSLREAIDKLDRDKDITVSTFRENDVKGIAPRKLYKKFGFEEGELIEEFGYPNQRFVLHADKSVDNVIIGTTVTVTVDRPLGSYHPEYKDMYYPINYGYIEGVMAPDGEEQDAYILGVNEPVKKFTGKIIAIVRRKDDIEEKWVVVPDGVTFSKEEIRRQIHFQEQYFDSEIVM
mgnify:CR=1 FL=1